MALIPCPHCGKEISSYAKRCPGCGKDLTATTETIINDVVCKECGSHYDRKVSVCPACGEPNPYAFSSDNTIVQQCQDTEVDYKKIFMITEDEFEGENTVCVRFGLDDNPEMDCQCKKLHAKKPSIAVVYTASAHGKFFTFAYYENDLVNKIDGLNVNEYDPRIGAPSRGLIINVDGKENIKLNALGEKPFFIFDQENGQDQFLQCCKANSLEFKVFKQEGAPIVFKGTQNDQEILIDYLRALYNYTIDSSMFPDAGFKAQKWVNEHWDELEIDDEDNGTPINTVNHSGGNTDFDFSYIFTVEEDEFDGKKFVYSQYCMKGCPELKSLCKTIDAEEPGMHVGYWDNSKGGLFFINYDDKDMIERLEEKGGIEYDQSLTSPCKGVFIIVDGRETLKLSSDGNSFFTMDHDQFLKCCKAHNLEFKVFKQEGKPIVIRGGKDDEEILIDTFQSLYRYAVNTNMFPNAGLKTQKWMDKVNEEIHEMEEELEGLKKKQTKSAENKKTTGIVMAIVGGFLFLISFLFMENITTCLILLSSGIILVFVGLAFYIYGNLRKNGATSAEAWDGIAEAFKNIH